MPVPASPAIASDIGHGALGLRDGLRPLSELLEESAGQRHVWIEARAGKLLAGWALDDAATATWVHVINETFDGRRLDVVGVRCGTEALTRAQTLAACRATAGTFYYAPDVPGTTIYWDDGVTTWDSGALWDQDPLLYIHRLAGAAATAVDVIAQLGIFWGSHGVWQPSLTADVLADGGLEVWTSATDLTNWTETALGTGGGAVNRDGTDKAVGTYSCRLDGSFNASGGKGIAQGSLAGIGGARYRMSGYYRTAETNPAGIEVRLRVGYSGAYLQVDGITTTAGTTGFTLLGTGGYWRRFTFDFACPGDTAALEVFAFAYNSTGGALSGSVWFDGLALQRIPRYEFYEPRLTLGGLPAIETARSDSFFGPISVGLGALTIANGNGLLEQLFASYDLTNQDLVIRVGGRFPDGGNEALMDDCAVLIVARGSEPNVGDTEASLQLEDGRQILRTLVPSRIYSEADAEADRGRVRPLVFGTVTNIRPARIGQNSRGYGLYEVADVVGSPVGLKSWGVSSQFRTHFYVDEEAADKADPESRVTILFSPSEVLGDAAAGRFEVLVDLRVVRVTLDNNVIDFNIGGGSLVATVNTGVDTIDEFGVANIANAMNNAASVENIYVTYDQTTHKFTIGRTSGTLSLLCSTGVNRDHSAWGLLGFNHTSNRTGALSYVADEAVFLGIEKHVVRAETKGLMDDASGTYTGTASAAIEKAPDVVVYLLNRVFGVPFGSIDLASFAAVRSTHAAPLAAYLGAAGDSIPGLDIIERIENGAGADIVLKNGLWTWQTRDASVPSDVVDLYDRDFLAWEAGYYGEDYYQAVSVTWNQNPTSGDESKAQLVRTDVGPRFGRTDEKTFETYLRDEADATPRLTALSTEAATKRRRFRATVKGKLLLKPVCSKVRITRTKGLGTSGALSALLVRLVRKRDDFAAWTSEIEAIEVV